MNENLKKAGIALSILGIGVAIGHFSLPAKIVTKIEIKEVTKEVIKEVEKQTKNKKNDKIVLIVETILPDGTRRKETKIIDKGTLTVDMTKDTDKNTITNKDTTEEKTVEYVKNNYSLKAMVGKNLEQSNNVYGLLVDKRFIGPITIGAFGLSDKTIGLSLGLNL